jgi:GH25 family lysozyme M1 (1,4-beta-N-acetylmuramidase)
MGGHGMMRGMFTQEERMMMFVDSFKATAGMTDDQKHAYRHERRNRIMAMTETDRAKLKADLDARWNALPAEQKASITAKMQAFMAARQAHYGQ